MAEKRRDKRRVKVVVLKPGEKALVICKRHRRRR